MKNTKYIEWVCPQGTHQARITEARLIKNTKGNSEAEVIDITFILPELIHPLRVYKAKIKYWSKDIRRFIKDFSEIVGNDALTGFFTMDSELIPQALSLLVNKEVDIETFHKYTEGYEEPLCKVIKIKPRGTLVHDLAEAY